MGLFITINRLRDAINSVWNFLSKLILRGSPYCDLSIMTSLVCPGGFKVQKVTKYQSQKLKTAIWQLTNISWIYVPKARVRLQTNRTRTSFKLSFTVSSAVYLCILHWLEIKDLLRFHKSCFFPHHIFAPGQIEEPPVSVCLVSFFLILSHLYEL